MVQRYRGFPPPRICDSSGMAHLRSISLKAMYEKYENIEAYGLRGHRVGRLGRSRQSPSSRGPFLLSIWATAIAILIISLIVIFLRIYSSLGSVHDGIAALRAMVETRLLSADYAKYPHTHKGGGIKFDQQIRNQSLRYFIGLEGEKPNLVISHAIGKLYLAEGQFNEAIACFEIVLKNDDRNAQLYNDLAVALMAKEKAGEASGEYLAHAAEYLQRAIELNDLFLDARYNLALCHQSQRLWRTAAEDWKRYLEQDSQSPKAEEARTNLQMVMGQINTIEARQERRPNESRAIGQ